MQKIGFLHTSPVHIPTFERLLANTGAELDLVHRVDEALLAHAVAHGLDEQVEEGVSRWLKELEAEGCSDIVCSCSTLGDLAEKWGENVIRVDRPMAAKAVAEAHIILMVAAIKSTLTPTRELLLDESAKQKRPIRIIELVVESAWPLFLAGDQTGYEQTIAQEIAAFLDTTGGCKVPIHPEIIVLAQGSMAGAAQYLSPVGLPILASPEICADHLGKLFGDRA